MRAFAASGSSPANPGITTYFDGVPQLNATRPTSSSTASSRSSSSAGRRARSSAATRSAASSTSPASGPRFDKWAGNVSCPSATRHQGSARLGRRARRERQGRRRLRGRPFRARRLHVNDITGHDLDSRAAHVRQGAAAVHPEPATGRRASSSRVSGRAMATTRSATWRAAPQSVHTSRDFEGHTARRVQHDDRCHARGREVLLRLARPASSGGRREDLTDLDYTPLPPPPARTPKRTSSSRRKCASRPRPTRRCVVASGVAEVAGRRASCSRRTTTRRPSTSSRRSCCRRNSVSRRADVAAGVAERSRHRALGRARSRSTTELDLTLGARFDYEKKEALLNTFLTPRSSPDLGGHAMKAFSNVSPQVSLAYRFQPDRTAYVSVGGRLQGRRLQSRVARRGVKATAKSTPGTSKAVSRRAWAGGRVRGQRLGLHHRLERPPAEPARIRSCPASSTSPTSTARAAAASSSSSSPRIRRRRRVRLFGYTRARFDSGTDVERRDVSGNEMPNTPDFTFTIGAQASRPITSTITLYGRGEVDSLRSVPLRRPEQRVAGLLLAGQLPRRRTRRKSCSPRCGCKNAFDTKYIPVALPYPGFSPSGFIGESGRPTDVRHQRRRSVLAGAIERASEPQTLRGFLPWEFFSDSLVGALRATWSRRLFQSVRTCARRRGRRATRCRRIRHRRRTRGR